MSDVWIGKVLAWQEEVMIPTYGVGQPNKNPMFLEKRVYQGSSGAVYPHPIVEHVESHSQPQAYQAVFLENRYLKIMLLPQLGGRVQMALDKTNDYPFVYYNRVIKPALVGLAGPWVSGGIEFNWPQHHRPSTFDPVDVHLEAHADGSQTVWFNEIERMFRTKGLVGFTLHPDAAFLELNVQLYNRTDKPQTFLWWANPAVHVNDDCQSIFPPDVHAVMDHGKRAVSDFPIATGTYYKVDYGPGTDISRYKNIPVPTSYMAYHSDFDFLGCYDHGRQAGMLHVANHHHVPGKKQWTWGNGDFGQAWDRQLTDEDGPYIELMCGAFTDNQPDFSWLMPGEERRFRQTFMPYKGIGGVKNASQEVALNLEVEADQVRIGVYSTRPRRLRVALLHQSQPVYKGERELSPETFLLETLALSVAPQELALVVYAGARELLRYEPTAGEKPSIPDAATPAPPPHEVASSEELFLHGLHLEQYRHATYRPEDYYEEALRRDPLDSRCNNALGLLLLRRAKFQDAEAYFRRALQRLTMRNPNPYDGEAFFNLGLALKMQGRYREAEDAFYKATWNAAWQASAYFELARLEARRGSFGEALRLADEALAHNARHHQAYHLKAACLRLLGQAQAAQEACQQALALDAFNFGALYEQALLSGDDADFRQRMRGWANNYLELALDYAHAGLFHEALSVLQAAPSRDPLMVYFMGGYAWRLGDAESAAGYWQQAAAMPAETCFPNQVEAVFVLEAASAHNPQDGLAPYLLGNFWYAHRRYDEAITCWEMASARSPHFATPQRNLGLAYLNKHGDAERARAAYERAFALDTSDARVLYELDQLDKKIATPPAERLARLRLYPQLVASRDDLMLEWVTLLNLTGQHQEAREALLGHTFHPWEGGEGKVAEQYILCLLQLARQALARHDLDEAARLLAQAEAYPPNLNEGKLSTQQANHIAYTQGLIAQAAGRHDQARRYFTEAAQGTTEASISLYYNDQPADMIFYRGLALRQLGQEEQARAVFAGLMQYGQDHLDDEVTVDYFAVSLPNFLVFDDDLSLRNRAHCHYLMALGALGLGDLASAHAHFEVLAQLDPNHIGAGAHRPLLDGEGIA